MTRPDPPDRSIFPQPDPDEWDPGSVSRLPSQPPPTVRPPIAVTSTEADGPSRRLVLSVGGAGLIMLLVGGYVAGSVMRPVDAELVPGVAEVSPTHPSPTATPTPEPSPEPSSAVKASVAVAPSSAPVAPPAGPPQQIATGGWASVSVPDLNVRSTPEASGAIVYHLVANAVAHVAEGPVSAGGYDWYRIASLGGATGWAASGPAADPYMTTLAESSDLVRCGAVDARAFTVTNGTIQHADPLSVGGMALPAAAFSPEEIGALELMHATGGEACFSAIVGSDGKPTVFSQFNYYACGRAVERGELLELHPSTGMDVVVESQVKDVAVIHPGILDRSGAGDPTAANVRAILRWMARADGWGCLSHGVNEGPDGSRGGVQLDARACGVIESTAPDRTGLRAAAGGDAVTLLAGRVDESLAIGAPVGIIAWFFDHPGEQSVALAPYEVPNCG